MNSQGHSRKSERKFQSFFTGVYSRESGFSHAARFCNNRCKSNGYTAASYI